MNKLNSPICVVGMHRSGTSMLNRGLSDAGVFLGKHLDSNHESLQKIKTHNWLLSQAHCGWDNPESYIDNETFFRQLVNKTLSSEKKNYWLFKHLGLKGLYKLYNDKNMNWGWKDPRTTLFMEEWNNIFPNIKYVHIYRHPLDVALSLQVRANRWRLKEKESLKNFLKVGKVTGENSRRVTSLQYNLMLWEKYVARAFSFSNTNIIHVKYEDLVTNYLAEMTKIFDFIGIHGIQFNDEKVLVNNAYKYQHDGFSITPELEKCFSKLIWAKKLGYKV